VKCLDVSLSRQVAQLQENEFQRGAPAAAALFDDPMHFIGDRGDDLLSAFGISRTASQVARLAGLKPGMLRRIAVSNAVSSRTVIWLGRSIRFFALAISHHRSS
jgi:hypothetical protein